MKTNKQQQKTKHPKKGQKLTTYQTQDPPPNPKPNIKKQTPRPKQPKQQQKTTHNQNWSRLNSEFNWTMWTYLVLILWSKDSSSIWKATLKCEWRINLTTLSWLFNILCLVQLLVLFGVPAFRLLPRTSIPVSTFDFQFSKKSSILTSNPKSRYDSYLLTFKISINFRN